MNIAVNTRLLLKNRLEGIGRFTYETLKRITRDHPEHRFYFLFDRPWDESFVFGSNVTPIIIYPHARHPLLYILWFDLRLPGILHRIHADLFLSPDGFLSRRTKVPSLAVFHDLNFEHHPGDVPFHDRVFYKTCFPSYARHAGRIATVSEFSRQDIHHTYEIDTSLIDVVYNGISDEFHPINPLEAQAYREKLCGGKPYFVFIGAQHPRKNLSKLFMAFDILRQGGQSAALVIAGARKWWNAETQSCFESMHFKEDVIFTGRLDAESLSLTLGSATALTYVSYFEGFGIPILEAFRCHVPVITSNVTAMPEVAGNAALLVNPHDPAEIASAMSRMLIENPLRESLITKGKLRLEAFSWDKTAGLLWESMNKTMNQTR